MAAPTSSFPPQETTPLLGENNLPNTDEEYVQVPPDTRQRPPFTTRKALLITLPPFILAIATLTLWIIANIKWVNGPSNYSSWWLNDIFFYLFLTSVLAILLGILNLLRLITSRRLLPAWLNLIAHALLGLYAAFWAASSIAFLANGRGYCYADYTGEDLETCEAWMVGFHKLMWGLSSVGLAHGVTHLIVFIAWSKIAWIRYRDTTNGQRTNRWTLPAGRISLEIAINLQRPEPPVHPSSQ